MYFLLFCSHKHNYESPEAMVAFNHGVVVDVDDEQSFKRIKSDQDCMNICRFDFQKHILKM